ncbi:MAG: ATP synthase F1 subunit epsilon [Clostridiales bacterium]
MTDTDKINVEIITPEKRVFHGYVERLNVPAAVGSTGVLADHAPLLTVLVPGVVEYQSQGQTGRVAISDGFMEVLNNEVQLLVKTAELAENIDEARALASLARAKKRLADKQAGLDRVRAEAALAKALARLKAIGK